MKYDFIIIGAGIVGLSTAWQLKKRLGQADVLLLEKEDIPAFHQTGHNSGVIHAGFITSPAASKPGSARPVRGPPTSSARSSAFPVNGPANCWSLPTRPNCNGCIRCFERCRENGLDPACCRTGELQELEPSITGKGAFLVRETGIVDFTAICREMLRQFHALGGAVQLGTEVTGIIEQP